MTDNDNQTMLGPYELMGELGRGAMARVWRAWDPNLSREVAIKEPLFDPRLPANVLDEMGARFVKEAVTAARLNHPNIVTIYAADVYEGHPAIVMELVEGTTLSNLLASGPLDQAATLDVLNQLLDAVGYAHAHGVVHRDIKPDNVFVTPDGRVKLADFGIARVEDIEATHMTVAGTVLGTPGYMSPEQIKGDIADARSDIFSIGVVAYEMLSGHNPFGIEEGISATTLAWRVVNEPVEKIETPSGMDVPQNIKSAVMSALEKNPANRPQSAEEFKALLNGSANGYKREVTGLASAAQAKPKRWIPYVAVGVLCVAVLSFVLVSALSTSGGSVTMQANTPSEEELSASKPSSDSATKKQEPESSITDDANETKNASELDEELETTAEADQAKEKDAKDASESSQNEIEQEEKQAQEQKEQAEVVETPSPARMFARQWTGTYTGHSSQASTPDGTVFRNVDITFTDVSEDGLLRATCLISSDDPGEGRVRGSYTLTGTVDWETGAIDLYGDEWIDPDTLMYMRQFHGILDQSQDTQSITGDSADLHNGANVTEWNMVAL